MILPNWLPFVVGILVAAVVIYLIIKRKGKDENSIRLAIFAGILAGGALAALLTLPATGIILVEEKEGEPGTYTHKVINVYGKPDFQNSRGETIHLNSTDVALGKTYLFNDTESGMLLYATIYASGKEKEYEEPDPIYVYGGSYDQIPNAPEFWFTDAPDTITERQGLLESVWASLFGSSTVKWAIIPYDLDEDEEDAESDESNEVETDEEPDVDVD